MTALAQILKSRGVVVSGSDGAQTFFTDDVLRHLKIPLMETFDAKNIPADVTAVISSTAYFFEGKALMGNVEVESALKRGLNVLTYPQALGEIAKEHKVIAVAGSHGKSTTTALLGWILEQCGADPTVIVGTKVNQWESNARAGKSEWLVIEADEYREAFLQYPPFGALITSIDYDHPDYFKTEASYVKAFTKLAKSVSKEGFLIGCGDDKRVEKIVSQTYGFDDKNDVVAVDGGVVKHQQCFTLEAGDKRFTGAIMFPGKQYVLNTAGAVATAVAMGIDMKQAVEAVKTFPGTARRLEIVSQTKDAVIIDDYAHHPTAITVTLDGIRRMYPERRVIALFQPHMYSRTKEFLSDFARCFTPAHAVGIMDVYPSARETTGPVGGKELYEATRRNHPSVHYLKTREEAKRFIKEFAVNGNVVVLMGAGDVGDLARN